MPCQQEIPFLLAGKPTLTRRATAIRRDLPAGLASAEAPSGGPSGLPAHPSPAGRQGAGRHVSADTVVVFPFRASSGRAKN
jgi:hypothetical protein